MPIDVRTFEPFQTEEAAAAAAEAARGEDDETFPDLATSVQADGPGSPRQDPEAEYGSDDGLSEDMREAWADVEQEVALAHPVPSVDNHGRLAEIAAGLFLPVFAPAYERPVPRSLEPRRVASPADSLPRLVQSLRDRFNTINTLHVTLISDCQAYTREAPPGDHEVPENSGPGPNRLPPVDRLNWIITAAAVARTKLLAELQNVENGIGQSAEELLTELRNLRTGVLQGSLHTRDPFQGAVLFQKLCYHRDTLIALNRLLYLHADGAAKSRLFYRDRVLTDLVDGPFYGPPNHVVPDWPRTTNIGQIRTKLNQLLDAWQGQEDCYRAIVAVCRTMIEAHDRLMIRAFLGTLSAPYILSWCRIYIASFRRSIEIINEMASTLVPGIAEEERRGLVSTFMLA